VRGRTFLRSLGLLLLGLWLGAAVFFSAAVAPGVFGVLRGAELPNANALAGSIITRLLSIINHAGFEISIFLLVMSFFITRGQKRWTQLAGMISLAIMAMMTGIGQWVISARMTALRAAMLAPIDQIAREDPRRLEFDNLHRYSVASMGMAIVAALVAFVIMASRSSKSVPPASAGE
jgi:ABC-type transport system involved in cytochrome bd biosynthesis fused ATPase/permease subunit